MRIARNVRKKSLSTVTGIPTCKIEKKKSRKKSNRWKTDLSDRE